MSDAPHPRRWALPAAIRGFLLGPVGLGLAATVAFYALIRGGVLRGEFYHRYFDSHWCLQVEVAMFFIGAAALVAKALEVAAEGRRLDRQLLPAIPFGGQPADASGELLAELDRRAKAAPSVLAQRLRAGLLSVQRLGSADELDERLRHLADADAIRVQDSYGLIKIVLWVIPILGFLGTVIGITIAIAALNPAEMEKSIQTMTESLNVAFDTTALALSLSIPLMFGMFYVKRHEAKLMDAIDARAEAELLGRFERRGTATDPHAASIRRMAEETARGTEALVRKQAELWSETIRAAHGEWSRLAGSTTRQIEEALAGALDRALKSFAGQLAAAERAATEQNRRHWEQVQQALVRAADAGAAQQHELARQGDVLLKVVDATGQVARLEAELNRNLSSLAGAKLFEETLSSLAATIHLLSARLGPLEASPVQLTAPRSTGKAA